ncbi:uncharacterized protein DUF3659 [Flavobacterium sp. 1]|uniref:DUF3659 domain-containing protein n=1 Tax=Flavobacterium sp. 1 TaxID=2035200 RepID=UPI000C23F499|nr:DUF3659 domain-containing protein [Flavobacterium sp. 1]PJJ07630.1 uncharacterized protein DUF3659 [Flavobacterium sp. 1]
MKIQRLISTKTVSSLIMFLMLISLNANAQTKSNSTQNEKIYINKKGEIYDHGWNKLGFITKEDIVKNNEGKTIYFIDVNGNVIDSKGNKLGRAKKNGSYYNIKGENVLNVGKTQEEKCEILDSKGHNMGSVHKNYKLHACAVHCLLLEQKMNNEKSKK